MLPRLWFLILLLVGVAMIVVTINLLHVLERTAACGMYGTADACCEHGECRYKPAPQP